MADTQTVDAAGLAQIEVSPRLAQLAQNDFTQRCLFEIRFPRTKISARRAAAGRTSVRFNHGFKLGQRVLLNLTNALPSQTHLSSDLGQGT